jgi:hypothetical protein
MSIQQFRAALSGRSEHPVVRAYRELSRSPGVAVGRAFGDWAVWPPAAAPATAA